MNLLFILENYYPHIGGVELLYENVCEGLAKEHRVTVLTRLLPGTKKKERRNGVQVIRVASMNSRYLFTITSIIPSLRFTKTADVVFTTVYNAAFPAWLAARVRGKPCAITVHEVWLGKWRQYTNFSRPKAWLHELFERMVLYIPQFDQYISGSETMKRQLEQALPKKRDRIMAIVDGFDPTMWEERHPDTEKLREKHALQGKFVIFASGRPGASKGFEYLLDAFPLIRKQMPDAALILMLSRDKQYAHKVTEFQLRAQEGVLFLEPVKRELLPAYRQMADCVVVPSTTEGFGYAVLESSASGTPVVASDVGSVPEVIYGKHVLVRPKDPKSIAEGVLKVRNHEYRETPKKVFPWSRTVTQYGMLAQQLAGQ